MLFKIFIFFSLFSLSTFASDQKIPILLIEPSFLHLPISAPILGAERTVIVPAWLTKNGNKKEETIFLKPGWKTISEKKMRSFVNKGRTNLSAELAQISPKWIEDKHGVIQLALLESPQPTTASTILAPDFSARFTPIFGPELLIAIPSSNRVYIFSKLISPLNKIAGAIRDDYKLSLNPVSTEFFELAHGQLRAAGSLD